MVGSAPQVREALFRLVQRYPGLHLRELARELGISEQLALYHLNGLTHERLVRSEQDGIYRRFFAAGRQPYHDRDRALMALLRQRVPFQIALLLLERRDATQKELVGQLALAKSTVSYHVNRLLEAGYLADPGDGRLRLAQPDQVRRLVATWRPPTTFLDRFETFWRRFYRPRQEEHRREP